MAMLASWWTDDLCQTTAAYMGADINRDGLVDIDDLSLLQMKLNAKWSQNING